MSGDFKGQDELERNCLHLSRAWDGVDGHPAVCSNCGAGDSELAAAKAYLEVRPSHYQGEKSQVWDFLLDHGLGFLEGNVIKYVARYRRKNGLEDLRKARTYLDKLIAEVEKCPLVQECWVAK